MAISFPAPEAARKAHLERHERTRPWFITGVGRVLRRSYERACSAIFDAPDDCMRL